jgi:hypothetical protein
MSQINDKALKLSEFCLITAISEAGVYIIAIKVNNLMNFESFWMTIVIVAIHSLAVTAYSVIALGYSPLF